MVKKKTQVTCHNKHLSFTQGCCIFFLRLNPYPLRSPSGLLAPDACARLFPDWAIWAAFCWSSTESKYSYFLLGCFFFYVLPPKTWTHIQTDGTAEWKKKKKLFFGGAECLPPCPEKEEAVLYKELYPPQQKALFRRRSFIGVTQCGWRFSLCCLS